MVYFKEGVLLFIVFCMVFNVVVVVWVFVVYFKERVGWNLNIYLVRISFNNRGKEVVNVFMINNIGFIFFSFCIKLGFVEMLIMVMNIFKFILFSIYKEDFGICLKVGCLLCY